MKLSELMEGLADVRRKDDEFLVRSRFFDGNLRIGIGTEGFIIRFSGGKFIDIISDSDPTIRRDYEVVGPESDWAQVWRGEMDIMQVLPSEYGSMSVHGDPVKFSADIATVAHLMWLLPVAAAELGAGQSSRRDNQKDFTY